MARKTIAVSELVTRVNHMIAATADPRREERQALAVLLESVLMDTGNYRGFNYLESELAHDNTLVVGYDDTRRRYLGGE